MPNKYYNLGQIQWFVYSLVAESQQSAIIEIHQEKYSRTIYRRRKMLGRAPDIPLHNVLKNAVTAFSRMMSAMSVR